MSTTWCLISDNGSLCIGSLQLPVTIGVYSQVELHELAVRQVSYWDDPEDAEAAWDNWCKILRWSAGREVLLVAERFTSPLEYVGDLPSVDPWDFPRETGLLRRLWNVELKHDRLVEWVLAQGLEPPNDLK